MADLPDYGEEILGAYSTGEWSAKEGSAKVECISASIAAATYFNILDYTVPAGKTAYVKDIFISGRAICEAFLIIAANTVFDQYIDAYFPYGHAFSLPHKAKAGELIRVRIGNLSAAAAWFAASISFWERTE